MRIKALAISSMGLMLLCVSELRAEVITDPNDSSQAIGITNLDVGGTLYDVTFTSAEATALMVYGDYPGDFDFTSNPDAKEAVRAVNIALTTHQNILSVGSEDTTPLPIFRVGYQSITIFDENIPVVGFWEGVGDGGNWILPSQADADSYNLGPRVWADFEVVPEPSTIAMWSIVGLIGGLVSWRRRKRA